MACKERLLHMERTMNTFPSINRSVRMSHFADSCFPLPLRSWGLDSQSHDVVSEMNNKTLPLVWARGQRTGGGGGVHVAKQVSWSA